MGEQHQIENRKIQHLDAVRPVPAARPLTDFAVETVGDELVILDGETMQYHTLNITAAQIWQMCDGTANAAGLAYELGIPIEVVETSVAELGEAGLLQSPSSSWDSTFSRRRATKLIAAGLVGAVGLPVIKSITVPDAAAAISRNQCTFYNGGNCNDLVCLIRCFINRGQAGFCQPVTSGGTGSCCVCGGAPNAQQLRQIRAASGNSVGVGSDFQVQEHLDEPVKPAVEQETESVDKPTNSQATDDVSAPAETIEEVPEVPEVTEAPVEEEAPAPEEPTSDAGSSVDSSSNTEQFGETSGAEAEPTDEPNE